MTIFSSLLDFEVFVRLRCIGKTSVLEICYIWVYAGLALTIFVFVSVSERCAQFGLNLHNVTFIFLTSFVNMFDYINKSISTFI